MTETEKDEGKFEKLAEIESDNAILELNSLSLSEDEAKRIAEAFSIIESTLADSMTRNYLIPRIRNEVEKQKKGEQDNAKTSSRITQILAQFPFVILQARVKLYSNQLANFEPILLLTHRLLETLVENIKCEGEEK